IPGWEGSPERHSLFVLTLPVAAVLLALYVAMTAYNLRKHREAAREEASATAWSLPRSLATLGLATVATALVSEVLVHSLDAFRPVEIATMGLAAAFTAFVVFDGRSKRWEGFLLVGVYGAAVVWYALAGDR